MTDLRKFIIPILITLLVITSGMLFFQGTPNERLFETAEFSEDYKIYALDLPRELYFAGEKVPMDDQEVRERFDRELLTNTYWQSNMLLSIKRANRWFPVIEPILKENNIPDDFKYLALAESGLLNVTSPAGARGFWQLGEATAKENGLTVTNEIDQRMDVETSTRIACKYLLEAKEEFGSWAMAAASYNMGKTGFRTQKSNQKADNYYDLYLNSETYRYIFRILAFKTIMSNPEKYGFYYQKKHLYPPLKSKTIQVDTAINDLADFAKSQGTNYRNLKIHNPWMLSSKMPNPKGKTYSIAIEE